MKDAVKKSNMIIIMFKARDMGITEKTKFLLFLVSSATNLLIATGKPNWASAISKTKVGDINIYIPMPSVPISLAKTIFINMLIILVRKPPIKSNITDFKKMFFFILKYMKKKTVYLQSFLVVLINFFAFSISFFICICS